MTLAKLRQAVKLQEQRQTANLRPTGLSERVIGLVSVLLDFLAGTEGEIARANSSDAELQRAVQEELGALSTFLTNRMQIGAHLALNTVRAVVQKKRKTSHARPDEEEQASSSSSGS